MTSTDHPKTQFFQACRGVFEGGGCRAAAHVGAFEEAVKCGVNFSEVAGTSAGAIVAALVGAGATPDYLLCTVAHLKFNSLLSDAKGRIATPGFARVASHFLFGSKPVLARIARRGSAYSSERIQQWVDDRLAELLPHAPRPIKFKDLLLPTWIVATDLSGRRAKVWSTKNTPDENVGFAVRCSCSIPLFFEPVAAGSDLYVDGGMLSNLPLFVFAHDRGNALSLGGRILAFRLEGDVAQTTEWRMEWLIERLIDTAISGATAIQHSLLKSVSTVYIPTHNISATDFDIPDTDVESLLSSGRAAVREFIKSEHTHIDNALSSDVARYGEDELFDDLVREMTICGKRMLVACENTKWFWSLFPSVAHWAFGEATIDVFISRDPADARESQRRALMESLGVRVHKVQAIPFQGFILNRDDDRHDAAFITDISQTQFSPTGAVYIGVKHRPVIQILTRQLDVLAATLPAPPLPQLALRRTNPERLIELLKKGVHQYADPRVSIAPETVHIRGRKPGVQLVVRRIRSYKYRQIANFAALHQRFDVPFGAPADIYANDRYVSTVTPPVLEQWGDDLVTIEGNTRIFHQYRFGADKIEAFVVRGVTQPLPGSPVNLRSALVSTYQLPPEERIKDFKYDNFRSIEGAARPEENAMQ
jgi:predicted acylesterase/phospholipase RssA